jgi:hypothetical protein
MKGYIEGRVINISPKKLIDKKNNKTIDLNLVTIIDDDAFLESDRYFSIYLSPKITLNSKEMLTKLCGFNGIITTKYGKLKFTVIESPKIINPLKGGD